MPNGGDVERPLSATTGAAALSSSHTPIASAEDPPVVPLVKTVRHRNKEHLRFVQTQACVVCAKQPADAHHLRFAQPQALGRKVSDEFVVPLCRAHHRELHRAGNELEWWGARKIAPLAVAANLWQQSQVLPGGPEGAVEPVPPDESSQSTSEAKPTELRRMDFLLRKTAARLTSVR